MSQESRRAELDAAAKRWFICGAPGAEDQGDTCTGSEDYTLFLQELDEGESTIPRWLCINASGGDGRHVYAHFCDSLEGAKYAAEKNIEDDIYSEAPVAIVDLDTGKVRRPAFIKVHWTAGKRIEP